MASSNEEANVGRRVSVFWPEEDDWFSGTIGKREMSPSRWRIDYDDGDVGWIDRFDENIRFIDGVGPEREDTDDDDSLDLAALEEENQRQQRYLDEFDDLTDNRDLPPSQEAGIDAIPEAENEEEEEEDDDEEDFSKVLDSDLKIAHYAPASSPLPAPAVGPPGPNQRQPPGQWCPSDDALLTEASARLPPPVVPLCWEEDVPEDPAGAGVGSPVRVAALSQGPVAVPKRGPYVAGRGNGKADPSQRAHAATARGKSKAANRVRSKETARSGGAKAGRATGAASSSSSFSRGKVRVEGDAGGVRVWASARGGALATAAAAALVVRVLLVEPQPPAAAGAIAGARPHLPNHARQVAAPRGTAPVAARQARPPAAKAVDFMLRAKIPIVTTAAAHPSSSPSSPRRPAPIGGWDDADPDGDYDTRDCNARLEWRFAGDGAFRFEVPVPTGPAAGADLGHVLVVAYEDTAKRQRPADRETVPGASAGAGSVRSGLRFFGQAVIALREVLTLDDGRGGGGSGGSGGSGVVDGWLPLAARDGSSRLPLDDDAAQALRAAGAAGTGAWGQGAARGPVPSSPSSAQVRLRLSVAVVAPSQAPRPSPPSASGDDDDRRRRETVAEGGTQPPRRWPPPEAGGGGGGRGAPRMSHAATRRKNEAARIAKENAALRRRLADTAGTTATAASKAATATGKANADAGRLYAPVGGSRGGGTGFRGGGGGGMVDAEAGKPPAPPPPLVVDPTGVGGGPREGPAGGLAAAVEAAARRVALARHEVDRLSIQASHARVSADRHRQALARLTRTAAAAAPPPPPSVLGGGRGGTRGSTMRHRAEDKEGGTDEESRRGGGGGGGYGPETKDEYGDDDWEADEGGGEGGGQAPPAWAAAAVDPAMAAFAVPMYGPGGEAEGVVVQHPPRSGGGGGGGDDDPSAWSSDRRALEARYAELWHARAAAVAAVRFAKRAYDDAGASLKPVALALQRVQDLKAEEVGPGGALPPSHPLASARAELEAERAQVHALQAQLAALTRGGGGGGGGESGESGEGDKGNKGGTHAEELRELEAELQEQGSRLARKRGKLADAQARREEARRALALSRGGSGGGGAGLRQHWRRSALALGQASARLRQRAEGGLAGQAWADVDALVVRAGRGLGGLLLQDEEGGEARSCRSGTERFEEDSAGVGFLSPHVESGRRDNQDFRRHQHGNNPMSSPASSLHPRLADFEDENGHCVGTAKVGAGAGVATSVSVLSATQGERQHTAWGEGPAGRVSPVSSLRRGSQRK